MRRSISRPAGFLFLCLAIQPAWAQRPGTGSTESLFKSDIAASQAVKSALAFADARQQEMVDEWIKLTEIHSASTKEQQRAAYLQGQLKDLGLQEVTIDRVGNVIGKLKGLGGGPTVAFAAHMDTVFPLDTPIQVKRDGDRLSAPGVGDDTSGCIGLLWALRALTSAHFRPRGDVIAVFTVQEETGLHGARAFLEDWKDRLNMFVAVDGAVGNISYGALGIRWYKLIFASEGSHTNRSVGKPNPAKAIAEAITNIYRIQLPPTYQEMGTVYNIGMMGGGKIFNAISEESYFTVDIRSADPNDLNNITNQVLQISDSAAKNERVRFRAENALMLPAAQVPGAMESSIFRTTVDVLKYLGITPTLSKKGSSDGNVGMEMGIPTVSIGTGKGEGAHTLQESSEIKPMYTGIKQLILLAASLGGLPVDPSQ